MGQTLAIQHSKRIDLNAIVIKRTSTCQLGLKGILSRLEDNGFLMIIGFVWGNATVFMLKIQYI